MTCQSGLPPLLMGVASLAKAVGLIAWQDPPILADLLALAPATCLAACGPIADLGEGPNTASLVVSQWSDLAYPRSAHRQ